MHVRRASADESAPPSSASAAASASLSEPLSPTSAAAASAADAHAFSTPPFPTDTATGGVAINDDGSAVVGNAGGDAEAAMGGAMALSSDVVPTAEDEVRRFDYLR